MQLTQLASWVGRPSSASSSGLERQELLLTLQAPSRFTEAASCWKPAVGQGGCLCALLLMVAQVRLLASLAQCCPHSTHWQHLSRCQAWACVHCVQPPALKGTCCLQSKDSSAPPPEWLLDTFTDATGIGRPMAGLEKWNLHVWRQSIPEDPVPEIRGPGMLRVRRTRPLSGGCCSHYVRLRRSACKTIPGVKRPVIPS